MLEPTAGERGRLARYTVRAMVVDDLEPAADLLFEAARPRRLLASPEAARRFLAGSLECDGDHNQVAICDSEIVAYTCAVRPRGRIAGFGPLAVHPDHTDGGLIAQMLGKTLQAASDRGVGALRLPMALHKSIFAIVYGQMKLAFTGETYIRLERRPGALVPLPERHSALIAQPGDLRRIVAFDRELFVNANRGRDYRLLLDHLDGRCWVLESKKAIRAFVFATPALGIGPLAAIDRPAAIDALRVATELANQWGQHTSVHINAGDRFLLDEALRLGYACRETVLVFERSLDHRPLVRPRGTYCMGIAGIP